MTNTQHNRAANERYVLNKIYCKIIVITDGGPKRAYVSDRHNHQPLIEVFIIIFHSRYQQRIVLPAKIISIVAIHKLHDAVIRR